MQKVRVVSVKGPLGKGDRKFYVVIDEKGAEFSTFDTKIQNITPGSLINIDPVVDGKYVNIKSWEILEEAAAPARDQKAATIDPQIQTRCTALTAAVNLACAKLIPVEEIGLNAAKFNKWLLGHDSKDATMANPPIKESVKEPIKAISKQEQSSEEAWVSLEREDQRPEKDSRDPESITTIAQLMRACQEDFTFLDAHGGRRGMRADEVYFQLGVNSQSELTGKPADYYRQIASSYRETKV